MKKHYLILTILFTMMVLQANCQTLVPGGAVSGEWTLAGSPYLVQGSIMIANDSVLSIHPGVVVKFQGSYLLLVIGRLNAIGTIQDSIWFTSSSTINGWRGIRFDNTPTGNDTSRIYYCNFEYGKVSGTAPDNCGGALYFDNFSKAHILHSSFKNCSATLGGAIYCNHSSPIIEYSLIIKNSANIGGGIYCIDGSNPFISHNTISFNVSNGIYCHNIYTSCSPIISYNNILNNGNSTCWGGGIHSVGGSSKIFHNIISANLASSGAGIYTCGNSDENISGNIISYNSAYDDSQDGWGGGGIFCSGQSKISDNYITNNSSNPHGGGIFAMNDNSKIFNNVVVNNTAQQGGGIYSTSYESYPTYTLFFNNTVANNSALQGGGLFCTSSPVISTPILRNTILWGDSATEGSEVYINDSKARPRFCYCDIQGGLTGFGIQANAFFLGIYNNNMAVDPEFVSPSAFIGPSPNESTPDWSLKVSSPCIDAGDSTQTYPMTDILGNPRVMGRYIDLGAFEYQSTGGIVNHDSQKHITVAPNPFSASTIIKSDIIFHNATLDLFNLQGRQVKRIININNQAIILQRDNLPDGIYFVRLTNDGNIYNAKLIIVTN